MNPKSVVFHKHHASMGGFGSYREQLLLERNALYTLYKNLDEDRLHETLIAAVLLSSRRSVELAGADPHELDIVRAGDEARSATIDRSVLVTTYALDQFVDALPALQAKRAVVQARRRRSDAKVSRLAGLTDVPVLQAPRFVDGYEKIATAMEVGRQAVVPSVLVITGDPLGERMAGPAIRAWNIAESLASVADVTLVTMAGGSRATTEFEVRHIDSGRRSGMLELIRRADIILFQGHALDLFPEIGRSSAIVIADVYDPMHLEQLEQARPQGQPAWSEAVSSATESLEPAALRADFLVCASERQRDLYLGQLAALGRLNPDTYAQDRTLRRLIDVVPFGIPAADPVKTRPALRGVIPAIGDDDSIIIWSGGIYEWFDPITLVRAIELLERRGRRVHLFFQGTKHPHPGVPEMPVVRSTKDVAVELGLLDRLVHFNESWVPYDQRGEYLLEADAGVSTHFEHAETAFSFRTRILDYLWAGLPIVCTRGDHFAALVEQEGLGVAVPESDPTALADALDGALFDPERRASMVAAVSRVRERYRWEATLEPLVRFVATAAPAADSGRTAPPRPGWGGRQRQHGVAADLRRAWRLIRRGQGGALLEKASGRARRLMRSASGR